MNVFAQEPGQNPVSVRGVMNVYAKKNASTTVDSTVSREASGQKKPMLYPSDSYQKILDYHVVEILLTTIVFGVVILLRLHR